MYIKEMKNAYGIRELVGTGNINISNSVIYASNGVFKSSFASTLEKLSQGKGTEVLDRFRTDKKFQCKIQLDDKSYNEEDVLENVLVYSHDLYQEKALNNYDLISQITILESERNKLDKVLNGLENDKKTIEKSLVKTKKFSVSNILKYNDVDVDYGNEFDQIRAFIELLNNQRVNDFKHLDKINWDNFFNDTESGKTSNSVYKYIETEAFKESVNKYIFLIEREIKDKIFDADFNDLTYNDFIESVKTTKFLNDKRTIKFYAEAEEKEFNDFNDFESFLNEKIADIRADEEVLTAYKEIESKLDNNGDGRKLLREIQDDLSILKDLEKGLNNMMISKVRKDIGEDQLETLTDNSKEYQKEINKISKSIEKSKSTFDSAIEIYGKRFQYSPVQPCIEGPEKNIALGLSVPIIKFKHKEDPDGILRDENEIYNYLSSGEKTALKILHFIVRYLTMTQEGKKLVLVFDDIVETFDYYNRNAMLEYINDIINDDNKVIVLTHNYDFFEYVASRIEPIKKLRAYTKTKDNYKRVHLRIYKKNDLGIKSLKSIKSFRDLTASIPFFRQIIEFVEGNSSDNYMFFTYLLHIKEETKNISIQEIVDKMNEICDDVEIDYEFEQDAKYYNEIKEYEIDIKDELDLKDKIFMSIQSRLISESIILEEYPSLAEGINANQTKILLDRYSEKSEDQYKIELIDKTLRITSEFIHLNSFMYEPLVDVNSDYLRDHISDLKKVIP